MQQTGICTDADACSTRLPELDSLNRIMLLMLMHRKQRLPTEGGNDAADASIRYLALSLYSLGVFPVARLNALVK